MGTLVAGSGQARSEPAKRARVNGGLMRSRPPVRGARPPAAPLADLARAGSGRPVALARRAGSVALAVLAFAVAVLARTARADEPPPTAPDAEWTVGVVKGENVNLRVGPRQDDVPVMQFEQGTVVVVVEHPGEWLGVRVPAGFL